MDIEKRDLQTLIEPFLLDGLKQDRFECCEAPALELLTHTRFDLAFKLAYLELRDKCPDFAQEFYKEHIRAFSLGEYSEPGNREKNTIVEFYKSFEDTFLSIKNDGFDAKKTLIPVSNMGVILNGAHRLASSIFLKKSVRCVILNELSSPNYNYEYFYKRNVPTKYLDFAATKFVEYSDNIYIAFIWPTAEGRDVELENIIPNIVYRKKIQLNYQGAHNLLTQIYFNESWLGSVSNDFKGAKGKLIECFKNLGPVRVVAFQAKSLDDVLNIKAKIREIFNIGKHSVHITDTHEEAIRASRMIFNDNSIHFLNNAKPNRYQSTHVKLDSYKAFLLSKGISLDDVVLDGGIVLSIYGLRECSDIDYLALENLENTDSNFDSHDSELEYHNLEKSILIYNPNSYFIYNDFKFISFAQTYKMKRNRAKLNADKKDLNDCRMMEVRIEKKFMRECGGDFKQSIYYGGIKLKENVSFFLKKIKLYGVARFIYRALKNVF